MACDVSRNLSRYKQLLSFPFNRKKHALDEHQKSTLRVLNSVFKEFDWNASRNCLFLEEDFGRDFNKCKPITVQCTYYKNHGSKKPSVSKLRKQNYLKTIL